MKQYSDAQLIEQMRCDNHVAFKEIYERYADKLIIIAQKKTGDENDAMDMVQDLFLSVWKNRCTLQINGPLAAYLVVSINYMIYKWYKKQKLQPESLNNLTHETAHYENTTVQQLAFSELNSIIKSEVDLMPEKMRQIYLCSRDLGMSGIQIAEELNISHQTVRNQISSALNRLKKTVHRYYHAIPSDGLREFLLLLTFFHFV